MRRFVSSELPSEGKMVTLSKAQSHHLLRVVGIAPNERVIVLDGQGGACQAKLATVENGLATLCYVAPHIVPNVGAELWMALALTKPPAFALSLRMLTEIGVNHIVPVVTERSQRRKEKPERWQRIILSALQQSGRIQLPKLYPLQSLGDMIQLCENLPSKTFLHPGAAVLGRRFEGGVALIGPEGGLSMSEMNTLIDSGWVGRSLGLSTLRADTAAAVAAGILLQPDA